MEHKRPKLFKTVCKTRMKQEDLYYLSSEFLIDYKLINKWIRKLASEIEWRIQKDLDNYIGYDFCHRQQNNLLRQRKDISPNGPKASGYSYKKEIQPLLPTSHKIYSRNNIALKMKIQF
jgi:hypothetical protein